MNNIEEILERVPYYSDGVWRRRFLCGLIFVSVVFLHSVLLSTTVAILWIGKLSGPINAALKSTQLLIAASLFVFAIGSVIDAMTAGFIVRGVSITLGVVIRLFEWGQSPKQTWPHYLWNTVWKIIIVFVLVLIWPLAILVGTIGSTLGSKKFYKIKLQANPDEQLSCRAREFFGKLPGNVQDGLSEPFSSKFDAAWQALMAMAPASHKLWVNRLGSRNQDAIAFVASALLGLIVSTGAYLATTAWSICALLGSYLVMGFLCYLSFGCIGIAQWSIYSVLEFLAVAKWSSETELTKTSTDLNI